VKGFARYKIGRLYRQLEKMRHFSDAAMKLSRPKNINIFIKYIQKWNMRNLNLKFFVNRYLLVNYRFCRTPKSKNVFL